MLHRPRIIPTTLLGLAYSWGIGGQPARTPWQDLPQVTMKPPFRAFWNVEEPPGSPNRREALSHGFEGVELIQTFTDYPGGQKENLIDHIRQHPMDPFLKPGFFQKTITKNLKPKEWTARLLVHDLEFSFVEPPTGEAGRVISGTEFLKAWATWYTAPCDLSRQVSGNMEIGIYGVQPFARDYWNLVSGNLEGHVRDEALWRLVDPHVDFATASVYLYYELPDSIYYLAANLERNRATLDKVSKKPLYAYEWLRYHESNHTLGGREVAGYLAEAMAVVPYFSGAQGLVLWGYEPAAKSPPYENLRSFMESLSRIAGLSEALGASELIIDASAESLWKARSPLIRKRKIAPDDWVVLVLNPWQPDGTSSIAEVTCGSAKVPLEMRGKHSQIYRVHRGRVTEIRSSPPLSAAPGKPGRP